MGLIRVVWGAATAPTELSAYDAALAAANVHDYNLVTVSSVIPANATVEVVGTAPDLGPVGERLTVVQGRATAGPLDAATGDADPVDAGPAIAGLGWSLASDGTGIFYEAAGTDRETVEQTIEDGLAAGRTLRDRDWHDGGRRLVAAEPGGGDVAEPGDDDVAEPGDDEVTGMDGDAVAGTDDDAFGGVHAYACAVVLAVYGESTPIV